MAKIIDFQELQTKKAVEDLFKTLTELRDKVQSTQTSNITDISDQLLLKRLQGVPKEKLVQLVVADEEGRKAFENEDYIKSAERFNTLIELMKSEHLEPGKSEYCYLVRSLDKVGRNNESIAACQEAIKTVPEKIFFYVTLEKCYALQGTLEGLDNARYCTVKARELARAESDFPALFRLSINEIAGVYHDSYAVTEFEHNFIDDGDNIFRFKMGLTDGEKKYTAIGDVPTVIINHLDQNLEISPKKIPQKIIFPTLLKSLRRDITTIMGKPIYFQKLVLEQEDVPEESISYRTFERD